MVATFCDVRPIYGCDTHRPRHPRRDPRRKEPFREVNCVTFSPTLLESDLFGHVHGAFTVAVRDRAGFFALPHKGALFLDEGRRDPARSAG